MKLLRLCALVLPFAGAGCSDRVTSERLLSPENGHGYNEHQTAGMSDLVATPNGWYHRDCVRTVPDGSHFNAHTGVATRGDGSTLALSNCANPGRVAVAGRATTHSPADNNYVEDATYFNGTSWGTISAAWHVPAAPLASYGVVDSAEQELYTFPALQPASGASILQPVLTYGRAKDYGGNYWTATSWYCASSTTCNHSSTVLSVSAGDSIVGSVTASNCAGGDCEWTVLTTDVTTKKSSTL